MSVFEIRSRITYRSLMNRTKDQLATQVMDLLREVDRLRERGDRLQGDLDAAEALIRGLKGLHKEHVERAAP